MAPINRRYVLTLSLVAVAILVVGTFLRPRPQTEEPIPLPSQAELSRLARLAQRRSLDSMTEYFATVAGDVDGSVMSLPTLARTAIVWGPGVAITTRLEPALPVAVTVPTLTGDLGAAATSLGPDLPVATIELPDTTGLAPARRRASASLTSGAWTVLVSRPDRTRTFAPASYVDTSPLRCREVAVEEVVTNIALTRDLAGAGLFDLDGNLVAVVLFCGQRYAAVSGASVDRILQLAQSTDRRLLQRYGFQLTAMTSDEQAHFGVETGLIVREVWTGYPAARAGIAPGDVIETIDAEPIIDLRQLDRLTAANAASTVEVTIRRQGRRSVVRLDTTAVARDEDEAALGVTWEQARGHTVGDVVEGGLAHELGIRPGDRLLQVDGEELANPAQLAQLLSSDPSRPVFLELERSGRRWGLLLP